jgi:transposase
MKKRASVKRQAGQGRKPQLDWKKLDIIHPDAAGIDIGGGEHWVAISPERDAQPIRCFGCYTAEIRQLAQWLVEKGVKSVAMQSTGVYSALSSALIGRVQVPPALG